VGIAAGIKALFPSVSKVDVFVREQPPKQSKVVLRNFSEDSEQKISITGNSGYETDGYMLINVILQNQGNVDAVINQFSIESSNYIIDDTPHFEFTSYIENGELFVDVINNGWGGAYSYKFDLLLKYHPYNENMYRYDLINFEKVPEKYIAAPQELSINIDKIESGKSINIFKLSGNVFAKPFLSADSLIELYANFESPKNDYFGETVITLKNNKRLLPQSYYFVLLTKNSFSNSGVFTLKEFDIGVVYMPAMPDTIYAAIINGSGLNKYAVKRIVPAGGTDNFDIFVASDKSASFNIVLSILCDDYNVISETIPIKITRYTDLIPFNHIQDGCEIDINILKKRAHK